MANRSPYQINLKGKDLKDKSPSKGILSKSPAVEKVRQRRVPQAV